MARAAEVPAAVRLAEVDMAGKDARLAVERDFRVFDVDVVDAVRELADELRGIHALPQEMARIEVEAERRTVVDGFQRLLGGVDVKRDFRRMDFQRELDAVFVEFVQNRIPHLREVLEAVVDHLVGDRREAVQHVPDGGAREAVDDGDAEVLRGLGGGLHGFDGPFALRFGLAVAFFRNHAEAVRTAVVVRVADQLAGEMVADGPALQTALFQNLQLRLAVFLVCGGFENVHVVAPAGQFKTVIAE